MQPDLEMGELQTGQTPREEIWRTHKARLYRYLPAGQQRFLQPLLLIYALINRPAILDLVPDQSLVAYLVAQGFDVYLLDWGVPDREDAQLGFEQYLYEYLGGAVARMLAHAHAREYSLLGYCMGGTMSAMYATLCPAAELKNLVLLATPIDFALAHTGLYGAYLSEHVFNPAALVDIFPILPGELLAAGNLALKILLKQQQPTPPAPACMSAHTRLAVNRWANESVPFAGAAFRQWISDFYQRNKLVRGQLILRGRQVDLARITQSVLAIAGRRDSICTLPQAEALMDLISSQDKEFSVYDTGHIGLLTDQRVSARLFPKISAWLAARSTSL